MALVEALEVAKEYRELYGPRKGVIAVKFDTAVARAEGKE